MHEASLQQIFDQAAIHLLTQWDVSADENGCRYRGLNGTKCAVGCFISDSEYSEGLESYTLDSPVFSHLTTKIDHSVIMFLSRLQTLHDGYCVEEWERELRLKAKESNLNTDAIDNLRKREALSISDDEQKG